MNLEFIKQKENFNFTSNGKWEQFTDSVIAPFIAYTFDVLIY